MDKELNMTKRLTHTHTDTHTHIVMVIRGCQGWEKKRGGRGGVTAGGTGFILGVMKRSGNR